MNTDPTYIYLATYDTYEVARTADQPGYWTYEILVNTGPTLTARQRYGTAEEAKTAALSALDQEIADFRRTAKLAAWQDEEIDA